VIESLPVSINDKIASVQELRSRVRSLATKGGIDLLCIDYLGLMRTLKRLDSKRLEVEDISRSFKEMAMEFNIPVLALCQLNREPASSGSEPQLHNLRESGSLEQDADNVIFIHVPKNADKTQAQYPIKLILAKQRTGSTGYVNASFEPGTMRFDRYSGPKLDTRFDDVPF
jgi:replicative DNA helicase